MAKFTRTYITCETKDGAFMKERITTADQIQYEKTARANGWTPQKDQTVTNLFMGFHSLRRTGQFVGEFEAFKDLVIDLEASTVDIDTDTGEEIPADPEDPTR